jgi:hypothetical protein
MGILDKIVRGNVLTGVVIGIGASFVISAVMPALSEGAKSATKKVLKSGSILYGKAAGLLVTGSKPAPPSAEKRAGTTAKIRFKSLTGRVKTVDTVAHTITLSRMVKGQEEDATIEIGARVRVAKNKKRKAFADINEGDKVVVKYREVKGRKLAGSLSIVPISRRSKSSTV